VRNVLRAAGWLGAGAVILAGGWFIRPVLSADVATLRKSNPRTTALMSLRDRQASDRGKRHVPVHTWVPLDRISPALQKAVLAAEDDGFYRHGGVEWRLMKDALLHDLRERRWSRGASTITQQLAKNLYLSPSKNPLRKAREILLAFRLERALTKNRIFELYLNVAEWGNGIYGAEAAAQSHFGKSAADLTWEEAIALAAVLPSPRKNRPTDDSRWVNFRKRWVRQRLIENRWLPAETEWLDMGEVDIREIPVVDEESSDTAPPHPPLPSGPEDPDEESSPESFPFPGAPSEDVP
jgi:monofunctional glycosyltransferase